MTRLAYEVDMSFLETVGHPHLQQLRHELRVFGQPRVILLSLKKSTTLKQNDRKWRRMDGDGTYECVDDGDRLVLPRFHSNTSVRGGRKCTHQARHLIGLDLVTNGFPWKQREKGCEWGSTGEEGRDCTVFVLQQREEAARILRVFEVSVTEEQLARLLRMLTQELE